MAQKIKHLCKSGDLGQNMGTLVKWHAYHAHAHIYDNDDRDSCKYILKSSTVAWNGV